MRNALTTFIFLGSVVASSPSLAQVSLRLNGEAISTPQASVEVYANGRRIGSGGLGLDARTGHLKILSARHVIDQGCRGASEIEIRSEFGTFALSCGTAERPFEGLASFDAPISFQTPDFRSRFPVISQQRLNMRRQVMAEAYCAGVTAQPMSVRPQVFSDGDWLNAVTGFEPGCSGSPLIIRTPGRPASLIGVMEGFSLENRTQTIFQMNSRPPETKKPTEDNRGDPVDGGPFQSGSQITRGGLFVRAFPEVGQAQFHGPLILHVPSSETQSAIPFYSPFWVGPGETMTCRGNVGLELRDSRLVSEESTLSLALGGATRWLTNFGLFGAFDGWTQASALRRSSDGQVQMRLQPERREPALGARIVNSALNRIEVESAATKISFSPGTLFVELEDGTSAEFNDPNGCYRSVLMSDRSGQKVVINFSLSVFDTRTKKQLIYQLWVARAKNQQDLEQGVFSSIDYSGASLRNYETP